MSGSQSIRGTGETGQIRETAENRESRESRETGETEETRETGETRDTRETAESREARLTEQDREISDIREFMESMPADGVKERWRRAKQLAVLHSITHSQSCFLPGCRYPGCKLWKPTIPALYACQCSATSAHRLLYSPGSCQSCKKTMGVLADHARSCLNQDCRMYMCRELNLHFLETNDIYITGKRLFRPCAANSFDRGKMTKAFKTVDSILSQYIRAGKNAEAWCRMAYDVSEDLTTRTNPRKPAQTYENGSKRLLKKTSLSQNRQTVGGGAKRQIPSTSGPSANGSSASGLSSETSLSPIENGPSSSKSSKRSSSLETEQPTSENVFSPSVNAPSSSQQNSLSLQNASSHDCFPGESDSLQRLATVSEQGTSSSQDGQPAYIPFSSLQDNGNNAPQNHASSQRIASERPENASLSAHSPGGSEGFPSPQSFHEPDSSASPLQLESEHMCLVH